MTSGYAYDVLYRMLPKNERKQPWREVKHQDSAPVRILCSSIKRILLDYILESPVHLQTHALLR